MVSIGRGPGVGGSVGSSELDDGAVTLLKLEQDLQDGIIGGARGQMATGSITTTTEDTVVATLAAGAGNQLVAIQALGMSTSSLSSLKLKFTFSDAGTEVLAPLTVAGAVWLGTRAGACNFGSTGGNKHLAATANAAKLVTQVDVLVGAGGGAGTRDATIFAFEVPQ